MMGIAFLVACRCNSCSFFYNVCTFAFGEINILLLLFSLSKCTSENCACCSYQGVDINDFSTSWCDGLAFNTVMHSYQSVKRVLLSLLPIQILS